MKNNIKEILKYKDISINELSRLIEKDYRTTHALVNRDSLGTTQLDTLVKVANVLDVDIQMLYDEEKKKEITVLKLYKFNYAGGLAVEALRDYKKQIEKKLEEKLNRYARLSYEYKSEINMNGVKDEINLEVIIGDRKSEEDRYHFYFKTKSAELIFKNDFVNIIVLCINEYEKGEYKTIESAYRDLSYEGYNHSSVELEKIEVE
ncbi:helix-turn-helix domain-containing protein [Tissierella praeacuta]|uniref:helix-turn-helix domain-containing protein n=1 Tax=Tissierella praeacuta TaxID=43131 RepID=UPI003DA24B7B